MNYIVQVSGSTEKTFLVDFLKKLIVLNSNFTSKISHHFKFSCKLLIIFMESLPIYAIPYFRFTLQNTLNVWVVINSYIYNKEACFLVLYNTLTYILLFICSCKTRLRCVILPLFLIPVLHRRNILIEVLSMFITHIFYILW